MIEPISQQQQYEAVRDRAAFLRMGKRTLIEVAGADRATFLHNLCTNDVRSLQPGEGREAFFTNVQGKILAHVLIFCESESLVIETVSGQGTALLEHLDRYLIREDVVLTDRSADWRELLLAGPDAIQVCSELGIAVPPRMLGHHPAECADKTVRVRCVPWLSQDSFVMQCEADDENAIGARLSEAGALEISEPVFETCRIESGFPLYGRDISIRNLPQEVGRDKQAISFTKGCYLGQETVARIDALGHVNRHLVGVRFHQPTVPSAETELRQGEKVVGQVTSASLSPQLDAALALAYVRSECAVAGSELSTSYGPATVLDLPI